MTPLEKEEVSHLRTIDQRDAAEETLSQMFYRVTGRNPEWSSAWGHAEALEEAADAVALLRAALVQVRRFASVMDAGNWRDLKLHISRQCEILESHAPSSAERVGK